MNAFLRSKKKLDIKQELVTDIGLIQSWMAFEEQNKVLFLMKKN